VTNPHILGLDGTAVSFSFLGKKVVNMHFKNLLAIMSVLSAFSVSAVEIIAHRGASYDAPENTLASMKLGYEQKADAGELDIYLSKDGKIVVMHDGNTLRTGGVTNKLYEHTWAELSKIDVGNWGKWKGKGFKETLPALESALKLIPDGKRMFIEVKCGPEVLPELERTLKRAGTKSEQTVIIGFGYDTVKAVKAQLPKLKVLWLVGADKNKKYAPVEELIAKTKAAGLDGLNLEQGFPINAGFAKKVHDAGLLLYTWTVDDPAVAKRLKDAGVDGITTNRPQWLREQLAAN
jgi:glycerophosphoryl diester phosphodiesterase